MFKEIAWSDSGASAMTAEFDEQKTLVDDVIADLENGTAVSQAPGLSEP